MPNQTVIKQWVDALRSGEYKQTVGKLHRTQPSDIDHITGPGMCCLGVLCDLAYKAGVVDRAARFGTIVAYAGESDVLPRAVQEWAGLGHDNPYVNHTVEYDDQDQPEKVYEPVTILNDDHRLGFPAIADAIEATYLAKSDAGQPA